MHSFWKIFAWLQNLTNPLPSGMAENYFQICTSDEFKDVTGQLINHKREIVKPATTEKGVTQLKNVFGSSSYPRYATNHQNVEQMEVEYHTHRRIPSKCLTLLHYQLNNILALASTAKYKGHCPFHFRRYILILLFKEKSNNRQVPHRHLSIIRELTKGNMKDYFRLPFSHQFSCGK